MDKKLQAVRHELDDFFECVGMDLDCYEEEHQVRYDEDEDMEADQNLTATQPIIGAAAGSEGAIGRNPAITAGANSRRRRRRTQKPKKVKKLVTQTRQVVKVKDIEGLIRHLVQERNLDHNTSIKIGMDVCSILFDNSISS